MPWQNSTPLPRSLSEALCEQSEPWKVARLSDGEQGCTPRSLPLARAEISILERSHPISITHTVSSCAAHCGEDQVVALAPKSCRHYLGQRHTAPTGSHTQCSCCFQEAEQAKCMNRASLT